MSSQTSADSTFLEKLTDGFSSVSDGFAQLILKLFGSSNERAVRKLGYIRSRDPKTPPTVAPGSLLATINSLEEKMQPLSDEQLKALTPVFRERFAKGETLDDLLPEAFAACREAGLRTKNMRHFDTQMLGGVILHRGNIAEMVTGEGKTLVATLPAYLNAHSKAKACTLSRSTITCSPRLRMDVAHLPSVGHNRRVHPKRYGSSCPGAKSLRLRHHLRHQQRIRFRLPSR